MSIKLKFKCTSEIFCVNIFTRKKLLTHMCSKQLVLIFKVSSRTWVHNVFRWSLVSKAIFAGKKNHANFPLVADTSKALEHFIHLLKRPLFVALQITLLKFTFQMVFVKASQVQKGWNQCQLKIKCHMAKTCIDLFSRWSNKLKCYCYVLNISLAWETKLESVVPILLCDWLHVPLSWWPQ